MGIMLLLHEHHRQMCNEFLLHVIGKSISILEFEQPVLFPPKFHSVLTVVKLLQIAKWCYTM